MVSQQRENFGLASESKWQVSSNPRSKHPDEGLKGMVLQSPGANGDEPEKGREAEPWPQPTVRSIQETEIVPAWRVLVSVANDLVNVVICMFL